MSAQTEQMIVKKKFRWQFEATYGEVSLPPTFVKLYSRPGDVLDFLNGVADKTFTTTFLDVNDENSTELWKLLSKFYATGAEAFKDGMNHSKLEGIPLGNGKLTLIGYDDKAWETWAFDGLFPHSINFGEMCYSSSAEMDVEITWRYRTCDYKSLTTSTLEDVSDGKL